MDDSAPSSSTPAKLGEHGGAGGGGRQGMGVAICASPGREDPLSLRCPNFDLMHCRAPKACSPSGTGNVTPAVQVNLTFV